MIEGVIIAGRAVGAHRGYIYIRGEYRYVLEIVDAAIEEAYARGYLGKNILGSGFDFDLHTHTGAGAYECGEESALMESLEGKRGYPRIRPPFPAVVGLYGSPTVINNVETLSAVPSILHRGGEWYAGLGSAKNGGTRLFCISGHVNRPGHLRTAHGLQSQAHDRRGRRRNSRTARKLKAVIPGGSSCPLLKAEEIDLPMDFDSLAKAGSMLGSGGLVVIDEGTCMVRPGAAHHAFLRARIVRLVHSLPRRHRLAAQDAGPLPFRRRAARRYSSDRRTGEEYARQDVLPAGRRRGPAHDQHRQEVAATNSRSISQASVLISRPKR